MSKAAAGRPNIWNGAVIKRLLGKTYQEWNNDQAPRLGAALAYYTTLSLAPLLILLIAVAGLVFGQEAAQGQLFGQIRSMVGAEGASAIQEMVKNASKPSSGIIASIIGFATLIFGASSVAGELKNSLNIIWNQPQDATAGVKDIVTQRFSALAVVLGGGFLLLVSLAISSMIAAGGKFLGGLLPLPEVVLQALNLLISLAVITGVFAVLFKYLPDVHIEWNDVIPGAIFTSVLFTLGKFAIGLYLGKASFGSTYGAAGSLVIVLVWIYYSSQIMFFGAEFTQVYAGEHGSDPHRTRVKATPKVAPPLARPISPLPHSTATGDLGSAGVFGSLVGSVLALGRIVRVFKR